MYTTYCTMRINNLNRTVFCIKLKANKRIPSFCNGIGLRHVEGGSKETEGI